MIMPAAPSAPPPQPINATRTLLGRFIGNSEAAAAVEFALVSVCLLLTLFFIFGVCLVLFMSQQLDYATMKAARQVMTGTVQKAALSQSSFQSQVVCSYLPAIFSCSNVIVNLQTATEGTSPGGYYTYVNSNQSGLVVPALSNASTQYSTGVQGSYEYLQVLYPVTFLPSIVATVLSNGSTFNGAPAYVAMSTAAFRNEQY